MCADVQGNVLVVCPRAASFLCVFAWGLQSIRLDEERDGRCHTLRHAGLHVHHLLLTQATNKAHSHHRGQGCIVQCARLSRPHGTGMCTTMYVREAATHPSAVTPTVPHPMRTHTCLQQTWRAAYATAWMLRRAPGARPALAPIKLPRHWLHQHSWQLPPERVPTYLSCGTEAESKRLPLPLARAPGKLRRTRQSEGACA